MEHYKNKSDLVNTKRDWDLSIVDAKTALEAAQILVRTGRCVVPIPLREKAPVIKGWPTLQLTQESLHRHFAAPTNIGLVLGAPSEIVDIDLDCPVARSLAPHFLSGTCRFGRKSSPRSYWLYRAVGLKSKKFQSPHGDMLLEIRSAGAQTVIPPSVHISGEQIRFENRLEPQRMDKRLLQRNVALLASATLLVRNYPPPGTRLMSLYLRLPAR